MWEAVVAKKTSLAWAAAALFCGAAMAQPAPLTVCMAADNAPLSHLVAGQPRGLDVRIAQAAADSLGRPLKLVPFESEFEKESTLAHEVAALLAAGVCEAVSGFPLLTGDFGAPTRPSSRTPDYPGAKRKRERPYIPLQAMAPGRGYVSAALGVVLPAAAPPLDKLSDLGERKLAVVSGTMAGTVAMGWKFGALRKQLVSLNQRESPLDELVRPAAAGAAPRFDALMLPLALFDGWRIQHAGAPLVAAGWRRPIGVNLGFVSLASDNTVRPAIDAVISRGLADGSLQRWAVEEGVTWSAPVTPDVGQGPSLLQLMSD